MNMGNTPQEQLAVIKYVHKRANIIGLVIGIFYLALGIFLYFAEGASMGPAASRMLFPVVFAPALIAVWYLRALVWTYYWLASKRNIKQLAVSAAVIANKNTTNYVAVNNGPVVSVVGGFQGSGYLNLIITCLILSAFVGTYLSIKHLILEIKLRAQLKRQATDANV